MLEITESWRAIDGWWNEEKKTTRDFAVVTCPGDGSSVCVMYDLRTGEWKVARELDGESGPWVVVPLPGGA